MVQDCTCGCESISDVLVWEGADENFVYSRKKNLLRGLVGAIVELAGMTSTEPGLTGTVNEVEDKVL